MVILLVDPHPLFREGLASLLSRQIGFDVVGQAGDAAEGARLAMALRPDIVLFDLSPDDGTMLTAARAIVTRLPDTAVVFMSIREDDEVQFAAYCAGARACLTRHVPVSRMLNVLRAVRQGEVVLPPAAAKRILVEFTRRSPLDGSAAPSRQDELTQDELSVLRGLAEAAGHAEIAAALGVSESSVRAHARGILSKLCRRQGADSNAGGGADGGA